MHSTYEDQLFNVKECTMYYVYMQHLRRKHVWKYYSVFIFLGRIPHKPLRLIFHFELLVTSNDRLPEKAVGVVCK
jgi:hypothetical protein